MIKYIALSIVELLIISPIVLLSLKKEKGQSKIILLFAGFFIFNTILLVLPKQYENLDFIGGDWNWTGKLLAIVGSLIFYFLFRGHFKQNDFLTVHQKENSVRLNLIIILLTAAASVLAAFFLGQSKFNAETLAFQLTMPGIEEEIAYRGIMLGLLITTLKPSLYLGKINIGNPSIWITGILFGLIHGLAFSKEWTLTMSWGSFIYTFLFGLLWGWMAVKSKSILMPLIAHNTANFVGNLVMMIK